MEIYIDGSCLNNPGPGGWASLIIAPRGYEVTLRGGSLWTTNNRMELEAFVSTLEYLLNSTEEEGEVFIYSDSTYVVDHYNQHLTNWIRRDFRGIANSDLWRRVVEIEPLPFTVHLSWVKAHSGNVGNERVDILAKRTAQQYKARRL